MFSFLFIGMPGGMELVIIVFILLLLFGAKKIPELARGLGQGINEFRKASNDIRKEIERGADEDEASTKKTSEKQKEN